MIDKKAIEQMLMNLEGLDLLDMQTVQKIKLQLNQVGGQILLREGKRQLLNELLGEITEQEKLHELIGDVSAVEKPDVTFEEAGM